MKLSIAWIFDHIDADWQAYDIDDVIARFNRSVAEIEGYERVGIASDALTCGVVMRIDDAQTTLFLPEYNQEITLPARTDAHKEHVFLLHKQPSGYAWAQPHHIGSSRDGLIPAVTIPVGDQAGRWKELFELKDVIIEVDNKSITHRPDMWGHRGFAREIAALIEAQLLPLDRFVQARAVRAYEWDAPVDKRQTSVTGVTMGAPELCTRFATITLPAVYNRPSDVGMTVRLLRVDSKPIDLLVDLSNYVMFDIGHPMHAFDADALKGTTFVPRLACAGESIELLDGDAIELTPDDLVITCNEQPVALAGVMGGMHSAVKPDTHAIVLEAAWFDPATIRLTAARHKKRTDASARFEKNLDPHQNVAALQRYLQLLETAGQHGGLASTDVIISVGPEKKQLVIEVSHEFIEKRLGLAIDPTRVRAILEPLGFGIRTLGTYESVGYEITVPTYRATKDISIPEDIVEEIGRSIGYDTIPPLLPAQRMQPTDVAPVLRRRAAKEYLAYGARMREIQSYPFFDEDWLRELGCAPYNAVEIANPVALTKRLLITSLVPQLLKAVQDNSIGADTLRFFEWNRVWRTVDTRIDEHASIAGVLFDAHAPVDFYQAKAIVQGLFDVLRMPVTWAKVTDQEFFEQRPWFDSYQTAQLVCGDAVIGYAGMCSARMMDAVARGSSFIFECNATALQAYVPVTPRAQELSQFQQVTLDVSMLLPRSVSVAVLTSAIEGVDKRISHVALQDLFEKEEWGDKRSVTMRYRVRDMRKTLEKHEIDAVQAAVHAAVEVLGAHIR